MRFGVRLSPAGATRADFVLPVGSIEETITVEGTAPLVGHDDASTGSGVDRGEIERLPLNGRGLLTLLEFTPGANVIPATRGEAGQFTATGQRPNANYFTVDGVSANTGVTAGGLPAQSTGGALPALSAFGSMDSLISLEAVQELRVTTSSSVAEFGRLPGASVALNSRSGPTSFTARPPTASATSCSTPMTGSATRPDTAACRCGCTISRGAFGGPLRRNRTFFFLSYQRVAMRQPFVWLQPVPSLDARQAAADWAQPLLRSVPRADQRRRLRGGIGEWVGRSNRPARPATPAARASTRRSARASRFRPLQRFALAQRVRRPRRESARPAVAEPDARPECARQPNTDPGCARQ